MKSTSIVPVATAGALALLFCGVSLALAQFEPAPRNTVTSTGSVVIKRQPEFLRLQIGLFATGKDVQEALAKLKERRTAAETQLTGLGVAKDALQLGDATFTPEQTDQQRQMEQMISAQLRSQGRKPAAKAKQKPPVVVTIQLKADLPLKGMTPEELLAAAHALQEKIKAADLSGAKDLDKLSLKDQEVAEEMAMNAMNTGAPKRGEPVFLFVSKISDEERGKALTEAFKKAQREAGQLARAAGAALGPLQSLSKMPSASNEDYSDFNSQDQQMYYYALQQARQGGGDEENANEAIGVQPGRVKLRVTVTAQFRLDGAGK